MGTITQKRGQVAPNLVVNQMEFFLSMRILHAFAKLLYSSVSSDFSTVGLSSLRWTKGMQESQNYFILRQNHTKEFPLKNKLLCFYLQIEIIKCKGMEFRFISQINYFLYVQVQSLFLFWTFTKSERILSDLHDLLYYTIISQISCLKFFIIKIKIPLKRFERKISFCLLKTFCYLLIRKDSI